jgi:hypothetical protein
MPISKDWLVPGSSTSPSNGEGQARGPLKPGWGESDAGCRRMDPARLRTPIPMAAGQCPGGWVGPAPARRL